MSRIKRLTLTFLIILIDFDGQRWNNHLCIAKLMGQVSMTPTAAFDSGCATFSKYVYKCKMLMADERKLVL